MKKPPRGSYNVGSEDSFWSDQYNEASGVIVDEQGFDLTVPIGEGGEGLYFVRMYVKKESKNILVSWRIIDIR